MSDRAVTAPIVLIADDDHVNRLVAERIVRRVLPDASVITAEDGSQAVERTQASPPHLILMDVQMPRIDGCEATEQIRSQENGDTRVPVIALTADDSASERERCMAAGMDDLIVKPITVESLQALLTRWLPA